jgi:hypothetical protein
VGKRLILSYSRRLSSILRNPFVWEVQVRREVLDDELLRLREVPYSLWCQVVVAPIQKIAIARDNKQYRLRVTAAYVRGSQDIRVTLSLGRARLLRRSLMKQSFVITPNDELRV